MAATLIVTPEGAILTATDDATELLGVSLAELQALPPGAFSAEQADPAADAAFRDHWEAQGRPDVGGNATLKRPDASLLRVRFAMTVQADGNVLVALEPVDTPVTEPPLVYTAGQALQAWRAAERRLATLSYGTAEWTAVATEIEYFRTRYQDLFRQSGASQQTRTA